MRRVFDRSWPWMWVIHTLVLVGCFAAFIVIEGNELIYALYIPLDLLFSSGRAAFFWYKYYQDNLRKEDKRKLKHRIARMESKRRGENKSLEENLIDPQGESTKDAGDNYSDASS